MFVGYIILAISILLVIYFLVYPQLGKFMPYKKTPIARPKPLLFDKRYGLCRVEGGEELSCDSFKLELYSDSGHTYHAKYFVDEIKMYKDFNVLCGIGNPLYIVEKDLNEIKGISSDHYKVISDLRNELELTKARTKINISDYESKTKEILKMISDYEKSKKVMKYDKE